MKRKYNFIKIPLLSLLAAIYCVPVLMMVLGAFKSKAEVVRLDLSLPEKLQWGNLEYVLENGNVLTGYMNSILMTVAATLLVLLFGSLAGIYVGRRTNKLSSYIYNYFVLGLTVSFQIATTFALLKSLNLYGTRIGVTFIYAGLQLPFTVMTFSSFVKGIPRDIDEAAIIDGCGPLTLIFSVLLPIMKPIMVTNLIVTAINTWNNFMVPLFYLDSSEKWTIPLMVYNFYGKYVRNWNYVFMMLVITILPVVVLYLCLQKYIVEGMTAGAVKG